MAEMLKLFYYAAQSIGAILLAAMAGAMIVRYKLIKAESLEMLSRLAFYLTLPCLLFVKVSASVHASQIGELWIFPATCVVYIGSGLVVGKLMVKLFRPKPEMAAAVITTVTFSNAGYIPIPLLTAVVYIFPIFASTRNQAASDVISLISMFLLGFSPLLWTIGFPLISGVKAREFKLKNLVPPPVIAILCGLIVGLIPPLKHQIVDSGGILNGAYRAAAILAEATIPCALLILGGRLSNGPPKAAVNKRTIFAVILAKLIVFPILAIFYAGFLLKMHLIPASLLFVLILVVEAGSPPANNLVVMASLANRKIQDGLVSILFWCYLAAIPTLTIFITLTIYLFKRFYG